jgi:hypothetical protein
MKLPALAVASDVATTAMVACASTHARRGSLFNQTQFKQTQFKETPFTTSPFSKMAIALSLGALCLTGCGAASTAGAAAPSSGRAIRSAEAPASPAASTPAATPAAKAASTPKAAATGVAATPVKADTAPVGKTAGSGVDAAPAAVAPAAAPAAPAAPRGAHAASVKGSASVASAAATVTAQAAVASTDTTQAATARGWGAVVAGDEFSNTGAPDSTKWSVFKGPGHAGKGVRSPQAWSVANGVATVRGDSTGTTGGMSAKFAQQKYGKWETRMRTNARDPKYHPVLILWPNNNTSPNCAEVDYAEGSTNTAQIKFFLHYACSGSNFQTTAAKTIDTTQWHNYAVEWTPAGVTGYIDGVKTFSDTNPAHLPSVGMHQTLQLDWFPDGSATTPSQMQIDWVRVYK